MPLLLKYQLDDDPTMDGTVVGVWEGNNVETLQAQIPADDAVYAYVIVETPEAGMLAYLDAYYVHEGQPLAKSALTIEATPNPFDADGTTVCLVTVTPFVPCTLVVNGEPFALTEGDETLTMTTDTPQAFAITVQAMAPYRAQPVTVEAV